MKFNIPYNKLFFGTIFSIIPIYFSFPYFLIFFIIINSILIALNQNIKKAIIFYLILSFFTPLSFIALSTKSEIGLIFNEYFFAGLPLYLSLPFILLNKKYKSNYTKSQKIIFYSTIILLFISNIIPGFLNLVGFGGYSIRLVFLFNFFNALVIFYYLSLLPLNRKLINLVSNYLVLLGLVTSIFGLFQYFFNVAIIPKIEYTDFSRLSLINMNNAVDSFPYLLVPFIIAFSKLIYSKLFSYKLLFINIILFMSMILTFSRWGVLVVFIIFFITIWDNRRKFLKVFLVLTLTASIFLPVLITIAQNAVNSKEQSERLTNANNLYVRVYLWGLAATAIKDNPFGYGLGNSTKAMFNKESEFNLLEENENNSHKTFHKQSVHQFFLDYMLSLGVFFGLTLLFLFTTLYKESIKAINISPFDIKYFYISIKLITIALFIFYIQNIGPQIFFLFLFLGFFKNKFSFRKFEIPTSS